MPPQRLCIKMQRVLDFGHLRRARSPMLLYRATWPRSAVQHNSAESRRVRTRCLRAAPRAPPARLQQLRQQQWKRSRWSERRRRVSEFRSVRRRCPTTRWNRSSCCLCRRATASRTCCSENSTRKMTGSCYELTTRHDTRGGHTRDVWGFPPPQKKWHPEYAAARYDNKCTTCARKVTGSQLWLLTLHPSQIRWVTRQQLRYLVA